ncbi:hypothetical protein ASPCAL12249 [Aspergillus calidoustus]|uniref:Uncharacterized protein n=1 Tax=Aspergillus calidoustus TaxID=454130 RepID=A0A0U4ZHG5_ASPCI|nr:hypothetical protein ASPCAL12249 [Aspergillus calidoustus]
MTKWSEQANVELVVAVLKLYGEKIDLGPIVESIGSSEVKIVWPKVVEKMAANNFQFSKDSIRSQFGRLRSGTATGQPKSAEKKPANRKLDPKAEEDAANATADVQKNDDADQDVEKVDNEGQGDDGLEDPVSGQTLGKVYAGKRPPGTHAAQTGAQKAELEAHEGGEENDQNTGEGDAGDASVDEGL